MNKLCIFNSNKTCGNCMECQTCDLNSSKICDSCGSCLKTNYTDSSVVNIDEILEDDLAQQDEELPLTDAIENTTYTDDDDMENSEAWELIGDIDGLDSVLTSEDFTDRTSEIFPGLIRINRNN
jgi:hypothetical protein